MKKIEPAVRLQKASDLFDLRSWVHPEHIDVEQEDFVEAIFRKAIRKQIGVKDGDFYFGSFVPYPFCGRFSHCLGVVDQGELAGRKFRSDERDRMAVAAADLKNDIVGPDVENINRPAITIRYFSRHD